MTLSCPRCHAQHSVDPPNTARAKARPLRFRCSDCGHTFPVQTESGGALPPALLPVEPPSRFAHTPRSVPAGEPVEMLRVGGDVYHVPDMATLQRWILEGRAGPEDAVSQHGMRWTAIGERRDLAIFFAALPRDSSAGQTIVPGLSPFGSERAGLGVAPEEDIYVQEVPESSTSFVATPPDADELPPGHDVLPNEPTSEAIAAEEASSTSEVPLPAVSNSIHVRSRTLEPMPSLALHPRIDEATQAAEASGPLDEVPPALFSRPLGDQDMLETLREPSMLELRADARLLGFDLGPDPDTQEATVEATQLSNDVADAFLATGQMAAKKPEPSVPSPAMYTPPPLDFAHGKVPITVAPVALNPPSILDDELPSASGRPGPLLWLALAGLVLLVVGGLGTTAWSMSQRKAQQTAERSVPAEPPATLADAEARARAAVEGGKSVTVGSTESSEAAEIASATPNVTADPAKAEAAKAEAAKAEAAKAEVAEKEAAAKAKADAAKAEAAKKTAASASGASASTTTEKKTETTAKSTSTKPTGSSAKALADAGWKAMDKGNTQEAHGYFSRALQADPSHGWSTYGRGYANEKLGDKVSAQSDYCSALSRGPSDGELVAELNGSLRRLGVTCR